MSARKFSIVPFLRNDRGHVAVTFGLISTIAVAAVGGAVDFGRTVNMRAKMQNALDNAVIAGLTKYKDSQDWTQAKATAEATFKSVFSAALTQADVTGDAATTPGLEQPVVQFTEANGSLTASATTTMNTPFMHLLTGANMELTRNSGGSLSGATTTTTAGTNAEVSMMIDLTGSMGWSDAAGSTYSTKIDALRAAGLDIVDILLPPGGGNDDKVRIAIAPFADYVNAGPYASAVTGLPDNGGAYSNRDNLAQTKNGVFTGTYTGATGSADPSGATSNGTVYTNGYCANPVQQTIVTDSDRRTGVWLDYSGSSNKDILGIVTVQSGDPTENRFRAIYEADGDGQTQVSYYSGTYYGYFVPRPMSTDGLTARTYSVTQNGNVYQGDLGAYVPNDGSYSTSGLEAMGFKKASSQSGGGYWKVTKVNSSGSLSISWSTSGFYLPLYTNLSVDGVVPGCESTSDYQASAKLISCVTERTDSTNRYTDALPTSANGYVGAYNHGNTTKSNYSSNGHCNTAGRELHAIVPLTNQRGSLVSFFNSASIGGATPGHLGTAWAWYMLSPNWSSVFSGSAPAAYEDTTTKKYAILMTDGEYNIYYGNDTSMNQALNLCTNMKAKGITVFTVGFGMGQNVTASATGSAAQRAKYVLEQCATDSSHHFFPYNGDALRTAFQTIGNSITGEATTVVVNGARITQ